MKERFRWKENNINLPDEFGKRKSFEFNPSDVGLLLPRPRIK